MAEGGGPPFPAFVPGTPKALDAVAAAPANHEVLFENDRVRVLRVVVRPGEVEERHTHEAPSVFVMQKFAKIKYFNDKGEEIPLPENRSEIEGNPFWMGPEGLHWVENHDSYALEAIRVELKT